MVEFLLPPVVQSAHGATRTAGFEIEFAGLTVTRAADLLARCVGGRVDVENRFVAHVRGAAFGDYRVEVDSKYLKDERYLERLPGFVSDIVEEVAQAIVPIEIVTPPIPVNQLDVLHRIEIALRRAQAEGTGAALRYAFGLHINPEVPSRDVGSIWGHLAAFMQLYPWLLEVSNVDLARRITPFIDPFPHVYVEHVLHAEPPKDRKTLILEYLQFNPTRNRPLDMLPLFRELEPELVVAHAPDLSGVNARPTFHYRLPNCEIDDPMWSIATEWNRWVEVECLAAAGPVRRPAAATERRA